MPNEALFIPMEVGQSGNERETLPKHVADQV